MKSDTGYKLPFEATAQIKRYLDDILSIDDEWHQKKAFYLIEPYLSSEPKTPKRVWNNVLFWSFLERKLKAVQTFSVITNIAVSVEKLKDALGEHRGIVAIAKLHNDTEHPYKTFGTIKQERINQVLEQLADMGYPRKRSSEKEHYLILKVLSVEPLAKLRDEIESWSQGKTAAVKEVRRFISMDGEGDFFIGKHRDSISFGSKKARYYKVFVALYKCSGGKTASVPYKKISEHIRLHFGGKDLTKKDIQNDINNSIKRRYLEESTPDGKEIIKADREGKVVFFYNPTIN